MLRALVDVRWSVLVLLAGAACALAAWRLDVFTPPHVAAARRVLRLRGLLDTRPIPERIGERLPFVRELSRQASLSRLLAISGNGQPASRWAATTTGLALLTIITLTVLSLGVEAVLGQAPFPFALVPVAAAGVMVLAYVSLQSAARRRQRALAMEVGDMLVNLGILVGPGGVSVEDALVALAKCTRAQAVYSLLRNDAWMQLVPARPRTQYQLFEAIAQEYDVPTFRMLAEVVRSVTVKGLDPLEQYSNLATSVYTARLAETQSAAARARIKLAVPIAGMILPLLVLLTAPLVYGILTGLRG